MNREIHTAQVLSVQDGRVLDGRGVVVLVQAAGNKDRGGEDGQLEELLPLFRDSQWPWNIGKDPVYQSSRSLVPHVSSTSHLSYALALLPLPFLPVGCQVSCYFGLFTVLIYLLPSYSPTSSCRWLLLSLSMSVYLSASLLY